MEDEVVNCVSCGRELSPADDDSILFDGDEDRAICRQCFKDKAFEDLSLEDKAKIFNEEALDVGAKNASYSRRMIQESLEFHPTAAAFSHLAYLSEDPKEAEKFLNEALGLDPTNFIALVNMPQVLAAQGRFKEALEWLDQYPQGSDEWDVHSKRACLLRELGRSAEAEQEYAEAMKNPCKSCHEEYQQRWKKSRWIWGGQMRQP